MKAVTYLTRRNMLKKGSMALVGGGILARSGWVEATDLPMVRRVTLVHPRLPSAFEGLRIAQVADVHAGVFMPPARLAQVRSLVEALSPDLVVFTGDIVDSPAADLAAWVPELARLTARHGVFAILGNHDRVAGFDAVGAALRRWSGCRVLRDEVATIVVGDARLHIAGLDDQPEATAAELIPRLLAEVPAGETIVLLAHHPNLFPLAVASDVPLTLAGHTHGGQIAVPSRGLNLARLSTPYIAGAYQKAGELLYVSRGIGVGAVPLRFGVPPEIDLITLQRGPLAGG